MDTLIISQNKLKFNVYRQDEPIEGRFFRMPKELYIEPYCQLTNEAKLLYMFMLDRMELSRKNKWTDKNGDLYILYARETAKKFLNCGKNKPTEVFKELKKFNLIKEVAHKIYVGKIDTCISGAPGNRELPIPETGNADSRIPGTNDTELSEPVLNDPNLKIIMDSSCKPEEPLSHSHDDYSLWLKIIATKFPSSLLEYIVKRFIYEYKRQFKVEHPNLKTQQLERCLDVLRQFLSEYETYAEEDINAIVTAYFKTNFPNANDGNGCDYNFNHFCTDGVLKMRFWEVIY